MHNKMFKKITKIRCVIFILICSSTALINTVSAQDTTMSQDTDISETTADSLQTADKQKTDATIINFSEYQPGSGQYAVKMTITDDYLRIDDSMNAKGFILFDRQKKIIYSVSDDNQQIVQINNQPVAIPSPIELKLSEKKLPVKKDAPLIEGKSSEHHQFFVNEKLCYEMISVPGLMPDAVTAMQNFKQVLAGQQAETLRVIPADLQEGCDLSQNTFYPKRYLQKGFPVMEKGLAQDQKLPEGDKLSAADGISYSRLLINYTQEPVSESLFKLPDYETLPLN